MRSSRNFLIAGTVYLAFMINAIQQNVDLWEIWIEYDQFHPEYFGTIYVHGEVSVDKNANSSFTKITGTNRRELTLQIPGKGDDFNTREVVYSEPIKNLNQYTSIAIYSGNELIGRFNDIEIMI